MEKVPRPPQLPDDAEFAVVKFLILEYESRSHLRWGPAETGESLFSHTAIRNGFIDDLIHAGLKTDRLGDITGGMVMLYPGRIRYVRPSGNYPEADFDQFRSMVLSRHSEYKIDREPL